MYVVRFTTFILIFQLLLLPSIWAKPAQEILLTIERKNIATGDDQTRLSCQNNQCNLVFLKNGFEIENVRLPISKVEKIIKKLESFDLNVKHSEQPIISWAMKKDGKLTANGQISDYKDLRAKIILEVEGELDLLFDAPQSEGKK